MQNFQDALMLLGFRTSTSRAFATRVMRIKASSVLGHMLLDARASLNPVHLLAMRVGFIRGLLWERYGDFWTTLVQGLEVETQQADLEAVRGFIKSKEIRTSGLSFQVAVAEAFALSTVDLIIAPHLNPQADAGKSVARGSGQDPWIASFPEALQTLGGLPPVMGVPVLLDSSLETLVIETLLSMKRDPTRVRLVWERHKRGAGAKRYPEPRWTKQPGQREVVAVLAQPWLLPPVLEHLVLPESHLISQHQLSPEVLQEEAKRLEKRLIATDAEVLGAAHYFNRKGNVDKLVMIVDQTSGADAWLEKQARKIVTKELEVIYLQDLVPENEFVKTLLHGGA